MIGVIICCCNKYYKQYEKIKKIWDSIETYYKIIKVFYLFGNPNAEDISFDNKTKILMLNVDDTYESLSKKIYSSIYFINKNYKNINYIFKTDDDIEFEDINLLINSIINKCSENIDYCGLVIDKVSKGMVHYKRIRKKFSNKKLKNIKYDGATYCYGAGYCLSLKSMDVVLKNKEYFFNQYIEDVCMGYILNNNKIYPSHLNCKFKEIIR